MEKKSFAVIVIFLVIVVGGCVDNTGNQEQFVDGTITNVVDGDTYDFESENGEEYRIRILGVDTPEVFSENDPQYWGDCGFSQEYLETWGGKSTKFVEDNYDEVDAMIEKRGIDPYDRQRAKVYVENESLSQILIKEGYATTFTARAFPEMDKYLELEKEAREKGIGIWSEC